MLAVRCVRRRERGDTGWRADRCPGSRSAAAAINMIQSGGRGGRTMLRGPNMIQSGGGGGNLPTYRARRPPAPKSRTLGAPTEKSSTPGLMDIQLLSKPSRCGMLNNAVGSVTSKTFDSNLFKCRCHVRDIAAAPRCRRPCQLFPARRRPFTRSRASPAAGPSPRGAGSASEDQTRPCSLAPPP